MNLWVLVLVGGGVLLAIIFWYLYSKKKNTFAKAGGGGGGPAGVAIGNTLQQKAQQCLSMGGTPEQCGQMVFPD